MTDVDRRDAHHEMDPDRVPRQVEVGACEALRELAAGNLPSSQVTLVFENRDLVDRGTSDALLRVNGRKTRHLAAWATHPAPPAGRAAGERPAHGGSSLLARRVLRSAKAGGGPSLANVAAVHEFGSRPIVLQLTPRPKLRLM
jgi:hypothetical protein